MENFKVEEITYGKILDKVSDLLPNRKRYRVSYRTQHIHIANAIRRAWLDNLPILQLYVDIGDVIINDYATTSDWLANRISLLPISQIYEDLTAELIVNNNSPEVITVYSGDIKFKSNGRIIPSEEILDVKTPLMVLEARCAIIVKNIITRVIYGYEPGGESQIACIEKWMQDDKEILHVTAHTVGNFHGQEIISIAANELIARLLSINEILEPNVNSKEPIYTDLVNVTFEELNKLQLKGQNDTLCDMLKVEIYKVDPNIDLVVGKLDHQLSNDYTILWKHPSNLLVVVKAINNTIDLLREFIKASE